MKKRTFLLISLFFLGTSLWADTQADIAALQSQKQSLQSELKKLDVRIAQTDSLTRDESKRAETTKKRQQEDLDRRRAELSELSAKISQMAQELQGEKSRQAGFKAQTENAIAFRKGILQNMALHCKDLEAIITKSLPWDQDTRLERVRALRRDLEAGQSTPEEGLTRLRSIYAEETRFGDEVAILNKPMQRKNGETINARLLRIGNQWMVYADEEDIRFGVLERVRNEQGQVTYTWREDLNFEERAAVKLAVDVKLARKPPQMVRLPLSLALAKEDK